MVYFLKIHNILIRFLIVLAFLGSVFLTSDKFVNEINSPKNYFAIFMILIIIPIVFFRGVSNLFTFQGTSNRIVLWAINTICFLQAAYGFLQFHGWLPSNNSKFDMTGSFDNPAGFAAVLSMGYPISLFLLAKAGKIEKCSVIVALIVISFAICLSGSRTGVLAILASSVVFLLLQSKIMSKLHQLRYLKIISVLVLGLLVIGASILYYQKKDSANGRLLIWKVSSKIITDKPILGHGFEAFQAKYMDYQAEYFRTNQNSMFEMLADNVKHPFNEFVKIAVEFGMIGLAIGLSFVLFLLWKTMKSKDENRGLIMSGLVSFMIFANFSYPLQYAAVWVFLTFYLLTILLSKGIRIRNLPISNIGSAIVLVGCALTFFYFIKQIQAEVKWKTTAMDSLKGNTEKMLPIYEELYSSSLKQNPIFLYNYGAELNFTGKFDKSIEILSECKKKYNDYDLQMLLADNYYRKGELVKATQMYKHAANMIPCRFLPIYQLFNHYRKAGQFDLAEKYANEIVNKKVKIESSTVNWIKAEAIKYLKE